MNKEFLHHDTYTDIITFNLAESKKPIQGEMYISSERVLENTARFGTTPMDEIHRVIFHGVLHLMGWDDKTPKQKEIIRLKETSLINKYKSYVSRGT